MVRVKRYKVGALVKVHPVHGGYPLPPGLPDGSEVRVVAFEHAYRRVEWEGKTFTVYMANIDSGMEECRLTCTPEELKSLLGVPPSR